MGAEKLKGGELDLSEYVKLEFLRIDERYLKSPFNKLILKNNPNLQEININFSQVSFLEISGCSNLKKLNCGNNQLTSIIFLKKLPHPEKLEELLIFKNNIELSNIEVFSKFINLKTLKIGNAKESLRKGKQNKFYGSLKSLESLTKLKKICIEVTDVDEGLQYLPPGVKISCSNYSTNAKCKVIQDQLRPFNYDLEAWQLAHPHKMYKTRPELFINSETKTKWITSLRDKINQIQSKLQKTKENEPKATNKYKKLETKLENLRLIQENISLHSLLENLTEKERKNKIDKETQTDLIGQRVGEMETVIEQLRQIELPPK